MVILNARPQYTGEWKWDCKLKSLYSLEQHFRRDFNCLFNLLVSFSVKNMIRQSSDPLPTDWTVPYTNYILPNRCIREWVSGKETVRVANTADAEANRTAHEEGLSRTGWKKRSNTGCWKRGGRGVQEEYEGLIVVGGEGLGAPYERDWLWRKCGLCHTGFRHCGDLWRSP